MAAKSEIRFYSHTRGEHQCFSNFSSHPVAIDGMIWPTTEHYFQAQKFTDQHYVARIRDAATPAIAKKLGQSRSNPIRDDWEEVKEEVMYTALRAKFAQHANARKILLNSGDAQLIEHTRNDRYWADGGDGSGKNRLGVLLMALRDELRETK